MKKITRIVILYLVGFTFLAIYFYIDNSVELGDFLRKADRVKKDAGFLFLLTIGFFKLASLAIGISLPFFVTLTLFRGWIRNR